MNEYTEEFEELKESGPVYCPICGKRIKEDYSSHECSKRCLNKIDKEQSQEESQEIEDRTFNDKLEEFEDLYNSETVYDQDDGDDD